MAAAIRPLINAENTIHIRVDCVQELLMQVVFIFAVVVFERPAFLLNGLYFAFVGVGEIS